MNSPEVLACICRILFVGQHKQTMICKRSLTQNFLLNLKIF